VDGESRPTIDEGWRSAAPTPHRVHQIDFEHAHAVAEAFLDAPRASADAVVRAAYAELADQVEHWYERVTDPVGRDPVRVVFTRCPEPYASAEELSSRVRSEGVLELCPVAYDRDRAHPGFDASIGGAYDRLRAVHDIVSHTRLGFSFDRHGEFSAWVAEDRMYSGLARWALATELHAEHSVLWTTGSLAPHKAALLPADILAASRRIAGAVTN
jgi:hypothetical protein